MMRFKSKKFFISGYYGHYNFGDEAILSSIISGIRNRIPGSDIAVVSASPKRTKEYHKCESVHKYDIPGILKGILGCDVFISGGGSLFQDVTSFKSLCYYLAMLFTAVLLNKKTFVYAQGIGPLRSKTSRFPAFFVLKKVSLITVRDEKSGKFLADAGINSVVTADPVWALDYTPAAETGEGLKIGIQLREWEGLNEQKLNILADVIMVNFKNTGAEILLIPLQSPGDCRVLEGLSDIFSRKGFLRQTRLLPDMGIEEAIEEIAGLDYMIAMRYHGGLVAVKYRVPSLFLSYDPKVTALSGETSLPCIAVEDIEFDNLDRELKHLIHHKREIRERLRAFSAIQAEKALENMTYLEKLLF